MKRSITKFVLSIFIHRSQKTYNVLSLLNFNETFLNIVEGTYLKYLLTPILNKYLPSHEQIANEKWIRRVLL